MANKYIIHGATYNGDGTTSSEAASDGAAGAWNTLTYFEGFHNQGTMSSVKLVESSSDKHCRLFPFHVAVT